MADERDHGTESDGGRSDRGGPGGPDGRGSRGDPGEPGDPHRSGATDGPGDIEGPGDTDDPDDPGSRDGPQGSAAGVAASVYLRDFLVAVAAVLVLAGLLFGVSGIWPPLVAVESGSMEPSLQVGDLVYVVDNERFVPAGAVESTGVVPADRALETDYRSFGGHGDVVVFVPDGDPAKTPIIHRAMLWVEAGENWYDRADPGAVGGAGDCAELTNCPAPHAGFVTLGDDNEMYDQATPRTGPVRPSWIVGTAELRVPWLGHVRLALAGQVAPADDGATSPMAVAGTGPPDPEPTASGPTGSGPGDLGDRDPTGGTADAASAIPPAAAGIA